MNRSLWLFTAVAMLWSYVTVCFLCHILMSLFKCNVNYETFFFQIMIALAGYMGHRRFYSSMLQLKSEGSLCRKQEMAPS